MKEQRSEAQMRAAAILLSVEIALSDLYPGRVSGIGALWNRKITFWINDLQEMIIDFTAEEGIRVLIIRADKSSGEGNSGAIDPPSDFILPIDADLEATYQFIEAVVIESADSICLDPKMLVNKIYELSQNPVRLRQAMGNMEGVKPPAPLQQPS